MAADRETLAPVMKDYYAKGVKTQMNYGKKKDKNKLRKMAAMKMKAKYGK